MGSSRLLAVLGIVSANQHKEIFFFLLNPALDDVDFVACRPTRPLTRSSQSGIRVVELVLESPWSPWSPWSKRDSSTQRLHPRPLHEPLYALNFPISAIPKSFFVFCLSFPRGYPVFPVFYRLFPFPGIRTYARYQTAHDHASNLCFAHKTTATYRTPTPRPQRAVHLDGQSQP